jgi:hypothetical protein
LAPFFGRDFDGLVLRALSSTGFSPFLLVPSSFLPLTFIPLSFRPRTYTQHALIPLLCSNARPRVGRTRSSVSTDVPAATAAEHKPEAAANTAATASADVPVPPVTMAPKASAMHADLAAAVAAPVGSDEDAPMVHQESVVSPSPFLFFSSLFLPPFIYQIPAAFLHLGVFFSTIPTLF